MKFLQWYWTSTTNRAMIWLTGFFTPSAIWSVNLYSPLEKILNSNRLPSLAADGGPHVPLYTFKTCNYHFRTLTFETFSNWAPYRDTFELFQEKVFWSFRLHSSAAGTCQGFWAGHKHRRSEIQKPCDSFGRFFPESPVWYRTVILCVSHFYQHWTQKSLEQIGPIALQSIFTIFRY